MKSSVDTECRIKLSDSQIKKSSAVTFFLIVTGKMYGLKSRGREKINFLTKLRAGLEVFGGSIDLKRKYRDQAKYRSMFDSLL